MANNDQCVANAMRIMDTATEGRTELSVGRQLLKQWLPVSAARSQSASCADMTLSDVTPLRQR